MAHDLGEPDTRLSPSEPDAEKQVKKCVIEFDAREGEEKREEGGRRRVRGHRRWGMTDRAR